MLARGGFKLPSSMSKTLPGFSHPLPLALSPEAVAGRALILSTTNGSVAIHRSAAASRVYAAALVNGEAVVRHVQESLEGETVLVVCAGSAGALNLEDLYGAGHLVSLLSSGAPGRHDLSDAALAARALHDRNDALECLAQSRIGRLMRERGLEREVAEDLDHDPGASAALFRREVRAVGQFRNGPVPPHRDHRPKLPRDMPL